MSRYVAININRHNPRNMITMQTADGHSVHVTPYPWVQVEIRGDAGRSALQDARASSPDYIRIIHHGETVRICGSHYGPFYAVSDLVMGLSVRHIAKVTGTAPPNFAPNVPNGDTDGTFYAVAFKRARGSHRRKVTSVYRIVPNPRADYGVDFFHHGHLAKCNVWFDVNTPRTNEELYRRGLLGNDYNA